MSIERNRFWEDLKIGEMSATGSQMIGVRNKVCFGLSRAVLNIRTALVDQNKGPVRLPSHFAFNKTDCPGQSPKQDMKTVAFPHCYPPATGISGRD